MSLKLSLIIVNIDHLWFEGGSMLPKYNQENKSLLKQVYQSWSMVLRSYLLWCDGYMCSVCVHSVRTIYISLKVCFYNLLTKLRCIVNVHCLYIIAVFRLLFQHQYHLLSNSRFFQFLGNPMCTNLMVLRCLPCIAY